MQWKQIIISAIGGAGLALGSTYLLFGQRLVTLERQLSPLPTTLANLTGQLHQLQKTLPTQVASVESVDNVREELKTTLSAAMQVSTDETEKLDTRIEETHQAILEYVNELNETLKTTLVDSLQQNADNNAKINSQLENTNKAIATLLETIKRKEEIIKTQVLPGTVMAYAGPLTPEIHQQLYQERWLVCDGSELPIDQYLALYQAIQNTYGGLSHQTFKLPDFRGVFLRGLDLDKQLDPQRVLGSYQEDTNKAHIHEGKTALDGLHEHQGRTDPAGPHRHRLEAQGYWFTSKEHNERPAITNAVDDNQTYWTTTEGEHFHGLKIEASGVHSHALKMEVSGEREARPKNYPVIYIIKF